MKKPAQISWDLPLEAHQRNEDAATRGRAKRKVRMKMDWQWRDWEEERRRGIGNFGGICRHAGLGNWPGAKLGRFGPLSGPPGMCLSMRKRREGYMYFGTVLRMDTVGPMWIAVISRLQLRRAPLILRAYLENAPVILPSSFILESRSPLAWRRGAATLPGANMSDTVGLQFPKYAYKSSACSQLDEIYLIPWTRTSSPMDGPMPDFASLSSARSVEDLK